MAHVFLAISSSRQPRPARSTLFPYTTLFRSSDLAGKSPDEIALMVQEATIFARVAPEEKATLIRAGQSGNKDVAFLGDGVNEDRKSTRLNSSHVAISYAVFCLKKKKTKHSYI